MLMLKQASSGEIFPKESAALGRIIQSDNRQYDEIYQIQFASNFSLCYYVAV